MNDIELKEDLEYLYIIQGFTQKEISLMYNVDHRTVGNWLDKFKIPKRSLSESKLISFVRSGGVLPIKEDLDYLYTIQGFSMREIGVLYDVSKETIRKYLIIFNITIRNLSESKIISFVRSGGVLPTKEDLDYLYTVQGLPGEYIGVLYNVTGSTIRNLLDTFNIPIRTIKEARTLHIKNKDIFYSKNLMKECLEQFKEENGRCYFIKELIEFFGCSKRSILNKIHEYKLEEKTMMYSNTSKFQTRIEDWLKNHNIEFEKEFSLNESGKRFDIKIKDKNVLIEANPGETHCIIPNVDKYNSVKGNKNYHKEKTQLANKHGYKLVHIYDFNIDKLDDLLSFLLPHERYHARETVYEHEVPVQDFIIKNHRQKTCSKKMGSVLKDKKTGEILMALTFKQYTRPKSDPPVIEMHLDKLCTKPGILVRGGFSKLLKNWIKHTGYTGSIMTFCDMDVNTGNGYLAVGFKIISWGGNYYYIKPKTGEWIWRRRVQKKLIPKVFPEAVGNTEKDLMESVGYYPLHTAGTTKLELIVDENGVIL